MKKIFLIWFIASLFFLFQYQDVNAAGANFSMHTVYSNIDKENQTVTLSWSPISGSEDVEIFISRD
jgi:hypothetical protein